MGLAPPQKRFMQFGVPFLIFMVGGSFGLKEFCQIRYDYRRQKKVTKREAIMTGLDGKGGITGQKKPWTLEEEYEKLKKVDLNNWENKRIPRPWEKEEDTNKSS